MTFRLPAELQRALRDIAQSRGEHLNQLVERALREFIDSASESLPPPSEIDLPQTAMIPELELPPYNDPPAR